MTLSVLSRYLPRGVRFNQYRRLLANRLYTTSAPPTSKPPARNDWSKSDKKWEESWYQYWSSNNLFEPKTSIDDGAQPQKDTIRMLLPPPNVTGQLHIGHALMLSIQDSLARYYRMSGHPVVWKPGTDHAGIATQSVVERMLAQTEGVSRHDLGREKLVQKIKEWRTKYGGRILDQMKRMGVSTTWSQTYYTLSPELSTAVENAFIQLHDAGLIYRDTRMVNWSCGLGTAVSDVEVEWKTFGKRTFENKVEMGVLWKVAYKIVGDLNKAPTGATSQTITVATTRPETIWGDRAIAVHPDDKRYKHLHYKYVQHPLLPDVKLPIIPDSILVDPEYGTGAVKITPAHDSNDYAFWKRHSSLAPKSSTEESSSKKANIPLVITFDESGKMLPACGNESFVGRDRLEVREPTIALLRENGALQGRIPNPGMRVGYCSRGGGVIEGVIQPQWYLATEKFAKLVKALSIAENKKENLFFSPVSAKDEWFRWLDEMKDWCLSRQIWWGHRVPAYRATAPGSQTSSEDVNSIWVSGSSEAEARAKLPDDKYNWILVQDEDVLDTWFSSGLLPLSTAGWQGTGVSEEANYMDQYPLTFLESGGDILFFWIMRMAMLGSWLSSSNISGQGGTLPFKEIILHPLICDVKGRKMSKSEGNAIDPLSIIDGTSNVLDSFALSHQETTPSPKNVAKLSKIFSKADQSQDGYGSDNLRWTLINYLTQNRQINFDTDELITTKKFFTKMINTYNFYHTILQQNITQGNELREFGAIPFDEILKRSSLTTVDHYILFHLREIVEGVHKAIKDRRLAEGTRGLREFLRFKLCDIYIEFIKSELQSSNTTLERRFDITLILNYILDTFARLAHPISPFITEELWQDLQPGRRESPDSLMLAAFPEVQNIPAISKDVVSDFDQVLSLLFVLNRARSIDPASRKISKKKYMYGEVNGDRTLLEKIVEEWREPLEFISRVKIIKIVDNSVKDNDEDEIASVCLYAQDS